MSDYLTLVAKSGQVNTPPGSYDTVREWISNSFLNSGARVLEVGCSTGFITIEISRYVQAKCCGYDLHSASLQTAKSNVDPYISSRVDFVQGDADQLAFHEQAFSHTVIGGHLPFVNAAVRRNHIAEAVRVTRPWGYLLTALYYYRSTPPQSLVDDFNQAVGTKLDPANDYDYWNSLFEDQRLTLEHESNYRIITSDPERIAVYLQHLEPKSRADWKRKLRLFNRNGRYLNYFVRVYRRLPDEDNLMIQIPRGGLYRKTQTSPG